MRIRPAEERDYPTIARLFHELETGDPPPLREHWRDELAPNSVVAEDGGEVIGYLYAQTLDELGYIRHVVVDREHRRRGCGLALMREAIRRYRAAGLERWCLNVKPDNTAAIELYEGLGMRLAYASVALRMAWGIVEGLARSPGASIAVTTLEPEDDAEVERAFGLARGIIRRRPGTRLLVAREGETIVGFASFAPAFPGAYPFRARSVAATRELLAAMRPDADPRFDYVQLVLEDADAIAEALVEAGARRHLEFVHYTGELPRQ